VVLFLTFRKNDCEAYVNALIIIAQSTVAIVARLSVQFFLSLLFSLSLEDKQRKGVKRKIKMKWKEMNKKRLANNFFFQKKVESKMNNRSAGVCVEKERSKQNRK
jgi:hypothetical protein